MSAESLFSSSNTTIPGCTINNKPPDITKLMWNSRGRLIDHAAFFCFCFPFSSCRLPIPPPTLVCWCLCRVGVMQTVRRTRRPRGDEGSTRGSRAAGTGEGVRLVRELVRRLVDWVVGRLIVLLVGVSLLVSWLVGLLGGWMVGWSVCWLGEWWLVD